jgi:hypothetical protein
MLAAVLIGMAYHNATSQPDATYQDSPKSSLRDLQNAEAAFEESVEPWVVKGADVTLVAAPADLTQSFDLIESQTDERLDRVEAKVESLSKVKSAPLESTFVLEQQVAGLLKRMANVESDVVDLSNGQADLTKRVEELFALIETRCPDGKVKTASVSLNATGSGTYALAPGEVLLSVDGVPVSSSRTFSSGGSNGSQVMSTMTTTTSYGSSVPVAYGGSNGNVSVSNQVYQTESYRVQATPTQVQVQRRPLLTNPQTGAPRTPVRTLLQRPAENRAARATVQALQCTGPNCPN